MDVHERGMDDLALARDRVWTSEDHLQESDPGGSEEDEASPDVQCNPVNRVLGCHVTR